MDFPLKSQTANPHGLLKKKAGMRKRLQSSCGLLGVGFLLMFPQPSPIPDSCAQLLLVLTPSYSATEGFLYKFQRQDANSPWGSVESKVSVVVGRSGLAWGSGLHANAPQDRPIKREGDGCSPAGIFALSTAFGFPAADALKPLHFPYQQITETLECVDDPASQHYNSLTHRKKSATVDWHSSERMHRIPVDYRLGVFVDHNVAPATPGGGSCIFLHVWGNPVGPTTGCTAMADAEMENVIKWLRQEANPVLVQLPQEEYVRLRETWKLPRDK